jgi:hypothetical protein
MVDQAAANPVAPVQRRVSERRAEHVAPSHADTKPPTRQLSSFQFLTKFSEEHRDVFAEQIPPGLKIEFVTQDVDAVSSTEVSARGFVEAELIAVISGPRLRAEAEEESIELRWRNQSDPAIDQCASRFRTGQ